jgi:hypothetical protein
MRDSGKGLRRDLANISITLFTRSFWKFTVLTWLVRPESGELVSWIKGR